MMRIKESERILFFLIFRLNFVPHDPYQADEIVTEIENGNKKFQASVSKALVEFY